MSDLEGIKKRGSTFKADTLSVRFKPAAIATTGDLGEVIISDNLGQKTVMTFAQAISLAHEILRRCGVSG